MLIPWEKSYDHPRQYFKKQRCYFANKGPSSQGYFFFFPVVKYECESWTMKKAQHQRIDAFDLWFGEDSYCPLNCKEIKTVNPKGNQS